MNIKIAYVIYFIHEINKFIYLLLHIGKPWKIVGKKDKNSLDIAF